jgi:putative proteasome-type protease
MTFCLGRIVQEGIVGIADSRLTSGHEIISAKKWS